MREINVSEFSQTCLALIDHLPPEGILITSGGSPIARLTPVTKSSAELIGAVPGIVIDPSDYLFSTGTKWDAES